MTGRKWYDSRKRTKGPGFALPPEGASIVFTPSGSLLEWWSNGVMKGTIQSKFRLSLLPTLQYSNTPVLQYSKTVRTCTGKAIEL
jgi:hypothetical protein